MTEPDPDAEFAPSGGHPRAEDLAGVVEEMEQRVSDERRADDVPGNADDRAETPPVIADDDAPD